MRAKVRPRSVFPAAVLCLAIAAAPAAAHAPVILDFGDSLTAGYGLAPDQAFPARLEAALRRQGIEARVVNGGVSGDTTAGGLARLDWALADKPDLVILALGANDALRGIDPSTVRDNLDKMLGKIEASGAKVLLLGMLAPPNWGEEYRRAFDRIFPELGARPRCAALSVLSRGCCDEARAQSAGRTPSEWARRRGTGRPNCADRRRVSSGSAS